MGLVEAGAGGLGIGGLGKVPEYGIGIKLPDIPLWVPDQARQLIADLTIQTMRFALQHAAGYISQEAPVSEGILAQSFTADPATQTGGIELTGAATSVDLQGRVFSSLPYAIVMDEGRRPGAPISRLGIDAIGLWAQRKLGLTADEASNAKWAIAKTIVAQGITGTDYFGKGVAAAKPDIESMFSALGDSVAESLTTKTGKRRVTNAAKFVSKVRVGQK